MAELIYSVRNIFNKDSQDGCLLQHNATKYLIPSYQRGYKWASDENGAVSVMLNDLKKAFYDKKKDYYLQYITVKETKSENSTVLELIDGQQRLTTLSIFVAVAANNIDEDFANDKLDYEVRGNFFQNNIHFRETLITNLGEQSDESWNKTQDGYYIVSAARKINQFLTESLADDRYDFVKYVFDNVKVIVNVIDRGDGERVFANLNSNKVNLTEAELIKGILLTKVSRGEDRQKRFREITEERMKFGIQWDEMARWCQSPEVRSFYFNNAADGMTELMKFAAKLNGADIAKIEKQEAKDYPLFNYYLEQADKQKSYENIAHSYRILKDLYDETEAYNLLGYLMSVKGSDYKSSIQLLDKNEKDLLAKYCLGCQSKKDLDNALLQKVQGMLKDYDLKHMAYGDNNDGIHHILLAINVFDPDAKNKKLSRNKFDFYSFKENNWTLEHIFPQNPEGKGQNFDDKEKEQIKDMIKYISDEGERNNTLDILDRGYSSNEKERNQQKGDVKRALDMVVNNIGNMCLLTCKDNPSNGNKFFEEKRSNILGRIKRGSFVPKHTFEVFSKTIFENNPGDLDLWTQNDMTRHCEIMSTRINNIIEFKY